MWTTRVRPLIAYLTTLQVALPLAVAAVAAAPATPARAASPFVVESVTASDSLTHKTARATCPTGIRATGGRRLGHRGAGPGRDREGSARCPARRWTPGWRRRRRTRTGFAGSWWLTASALCAALPDRPQAHGDHIVTGNDRSTLQVPCPYLSATRTRWAYAAGAYGIGDPGLIMTGLHPMPHGRSTASVFYEHAQARRRRPTTSPRPGARAAS